jgi:hypothetical protein
LGGIEARQGVDDVEAGVLGERVCLLTGFDGRGIYVSVKETKPSKVVVVDAGGLPRIDDLLEGFAGTREVGFIFGLVGRLKEEVMVRGSLGEASVEKGGPGSVVVEEPRLHSRRAQGQP